MYSSFSGLMNVGLKYSDVIITRVDYGVYSTSNTTVNEISFPSSINTLITTVDDPVTIEFFIKNNSDRLYDSPGKYLFGIGNSSNGILLEIRYANLGQNRFHMYDPGPNGIFRYSTAGRNYNRSATSSPAWHHIAFVYKTSDETNYIYIDGIRMANNAGYTESVLRAYVNQTSNTLNSNLASSGLKMYILSTNTNSGNNMTSNVNTPIHNLRITKREVYTNNFTPPTGRLGITQPAGTNINAIGADQCVFCLESYIENGITVIKDMVQNISLTSMLSLDTATGVRTI